MKSVVVLGASGMLGSMVLNVLALDHRLQVMATVRTVDLQKTGQRAWPQVNWRLVDAEGAGVGENQFQFIPESSWIVNCIGVIKQRLEEDKASDVKRALLVNALFPHVLSQVAQEKSCRVLQIATDCVYSGTKGKYLEGVPHDALDVYGKTKSLGEVRSSQVHHLRCSIIGPEPKGHVSLLDWFRGQRPGACIQGYLDHWWNGVTTLHFAGICHGIIREDLPLPHLQHVIPSGTIAKADLLKCFAREYRREDVTITPTAAPAVIDRTLATADPNLNRRLWTAAGYAEPPTVPQMVAELARFDYRFGKP